VTGKRKTVKQLLDIPPPGLKRCRIVASAMKERTAQREKTLPNHLLSRYLALLVSLSGNNILQ
ncbi:MAG TPA: hypothetical protein P5054_03460, partial [Desulfomonilia bacterium]|nr:hypothetical protein [Desulfomonilia bacterium]